MTNHEQQKNSTRKEHDLLGECRLPCSAYYGIQTMRAFENFQISTYQLSSFPELILGLAQIKKAAALTNTSLKVLDKKIAQPIIQACDEIIEGRFYDQFIVDMLQGGAGTSTNMNANEVITNRALELAGHKKGEYNIIHPNNHVNLSQSTNDAYPSAIRLALLSSLPTLKQSLKKLIQSFQKKSREFSTMIKIGRTQLQDAIPMTLGQEFNTFSTTLLKELKQITTIEKILLELNMGGTAIGTGLNSHPQYAQTVINKLCKITGFKLTLSSDLIEASQDTGAFVSLSSALKSCAIKLSKISNDLRLLSSGPRCGFYDITLPAVQPGSSIMPGKINPVIPEMMNQVAFQIIGADLTITMASEAGQLQLNAFEPIIAFNLLQNIKMMSRAINTCAEKCINNIRANTKQCQTHVESAIGVITALNPIIGYENSTKIAKESLETGETVFNLVLKYKLIKRTELNKLLTPKNMVDNKK